MTPASIDQLSLNRIAATKSGMFGDRAHARWRDPDAEWAVPLAITLPVTLVVSLGLWAGIILAVKSLFF